MSAIDQLDLRPEEVLVRLENEAFEQAVHDKIDRMWDWPASPVFAHTARVRTIEFVIHADTSEFQRALDQMHAAGRLVSQTWNDYFTWPAVEGGAFLYHRFYSRWNMPDNWPVYCLAVGGSILLGLLIGAQPW